MSPLRLNGSTSGYSELEAPAIAGDQTFTLPGTGGTLDRLNRAGNILQVVSTTKTDTTSTTSSTYADMTGMSVSITPTSATSKILVTATVNLGTNAANNFVFVKLVRDSTDLLIGDAAGSRRRASIGTSSTDTSIHTTGVILLLDSPATTSAVTYKLQWATTGFTAYLNRTYTDGDNISTTRTASSITVMEVAA